MTTETLTPRSRRAIRTAGIRSAAGVAVAALATPLIVP